MVIVSLVRRAVMRAIRVHQWGGPEVLKVETGLAIPAPGADQVRDLSYHTYVRC